MRTLNDVLADVRRLQDEVRTIVSDAVAPDKPEKIVIYDGYFTTSIDLDPTGVECVVLTAESSAGQEVVLYLDTFPFMKAVLGIASVFFQQAQQLKEKAA